MNCAPRAEYEKCPPNAATVVVVGYLEQEQQYLQTLFAGLERTLPHPCQWDVQTETSVDATLLALRRDRVAVVLCDRDLMPEAWRELLARFDGLSAPPSLIVTSRLADEYLWAEALNLGAYDVLARPFDRAEVVRSVGLARMHWQQTAPGPQVARSVA